MLEQEIKSYLIRTGIPFTDSSASHTALDFLLTRHNIHIDAKEKRQPFSMQNWKEAPMPQEFLFIIDDLAVRKVLLSAPNSFILIQDSSASPVTYYVYSIVDLLCIPKIRCRRPIRRSTAAFKGKWLVDLRNAATFQSLEDSINYIIAYTKKRKAVFETHIDCWGKYPTERLATSGSVRTSKYWEEDSKAHS